MNSNQLKIIFLCLVLALLASCGAKFKSFKGLDLTDSASTAQFKPTSFSEAYPILQAKCMTCHNENGKAWVAPFNFKTEQEFFASKWFKNGDISSPAIQRMIGSGSSNASMPRDGVAWSNAEFQTVRNWIMTVRAPASEPPIASEPYNPAFMCTSAPAPVSAEIKRLPKIYYVNTLRSFLSRLSTANVDTLIGSLQSKIDQIPMDVGVDYTKRDNSITSAHVNTILDVAVDLALKIVADTNYSNQLISICGSTSTKASITNSTCLNNFIKYYGRKALRRPLSNSEIQGIIAMANTQTTNENKIASIVARLLAHPRLYYRLDNEGSLASGTEGVDATYNLTKYELAAKISFVLWSAPPDDAANTLVDQVDLSTSAGLEQYLNFVLADNRARTGLSLFTYDWLSLKKTPVLDATSAAFQSLIASDTGVKSANFKNEMVDEVLDLVLHYSLSTKGRYEDLLRSKKSFARTSTLANIYGVTAWNGNPANLADFPADRPRSGLLTRAAFLASNSEYTKPILKGKRIRTNLLCDDVPPPPPGLNIKPMIQEPGLLTSEVVSRATADATCMACHQYMNPLGFSTENYDSLGRYRTKELKYDGSGNIVNVLTPNTTGDALLYTNDTMRILNADNLSEHIIESGKGQRCIVRNFFRFATDRSEDVNADACALEDMRLKLTNQGGSLQDMIKATLSSKAFTQRKIK